MPDVKAALPIGRNPTHLLKLAAICLLSFLLALYGLSQKADLHNDEYTTYIIANNGGEGGMVFYPQDGVWYDDPAQPYLDAMTVPAGGGFHYAKVLENNKSDTLPPLYYCLLHTVCSFFPGQFSVWFAGGLNLLFLMLSLWTLEDLLRRMGVKEGGRLLSCLLVGVMPGVIEIAQFLRMYTLAMFWVILLCDGHVRFFQSPRYGWKDALWVALPTIGGVLTHYYFVLFALFQCLMAGLWLLGRKRWKDAGFYALTFLAAAGATIAIYPGILQQVFFGWLTPTSVENLTAGGDFMQRLKGFYFVVNTRIFGGYLPLFALACLLGLGLWLRPGKKRMWEGENLLWLALLIPTGLYFLLMTKIAFFPNTRYMCLIYPLLLCLAVEALQRLLCLKGEGPNGLWGVAALLCAMMIIGSYQLYPVEDREYTGHNAQASLDAMAEYSDQTAVCVYTSYWMADNTYRLNQNLKGLLFLKPEDLSQLPQALGQTPASFLLEVENSQNQEEVLQRVRELCPAYTQALPVTESTYYSVYLLS